MATSPPSNVVPFDAFTPLKVGMRGDVVLQLQKTLTDRGFDPGKLDGIFGVNTERAVKAFQMSAGLLASGVVAADTRRALLRPMDPQLAARMRKLMAQQEARQQAAAKNTAGNTTGTAMIPGGETFGPPAPPEGGIAALLQNKMVLLGIAAALLLGAYLLSKGKATKFEDFQDGTPDDYRPRRVEVIDADEDEEEDFEEDEEEEEEEKPKKRRKAKAKKG